MRDTDRHSPAIDEDRYESVIGEAIAASNSDIYGALRALLIANELLEVEVATLRRQQQMTMPASARKAKAAVEQRPFVYEAPQPGTVLLWESWLRHEVPLNQSAEERISVSFNYRWR